MHQGYAMKTLSIHRILVPSDLSEPAHHALGYAKLLAERFGAHVDVVYADPVLPPLTFFEDGSAMLSGSSADWERTDVAARLRDEAATCLGAGISFNVHVVEGAALPMIVKTAETLDSDLIIIGTRGLRGWRRTALGSLTEEIVHATDRLVLTVKLADHTFGPGIAKVLCPVNMTEVARESLRVAATLASQLGAELIIAHVVEDDREIAEAQPLLRRWLNESGLGGVGWRDLVVRGGAAERVLDCAEDLDVDLLVIGAQHQFFSDETVIGTTTERLLRFALCPVLTVTRSAVSKEKETAPETVAAS